jgi:small subunit ribosomal protein S5
MTERNRNRDRDRDEDDRGVESSTIGVFRSAKVVKGGKNFAFEALVAAGDKQGNIGIGYGKAKEVPAAVEKATKDARRRMVKIQLAGGTIPHEVMGSFGASKIKLVPARPGTGIKAGRYVRPVLELVGIRDILTKAFGSTNKKNLSKAALSALQSLRTKETITENRGVTL